MEWLGLGLGVLGGWDVRGVLGLKCVWGVKGVLGLRCVCDVWGLRCLRFLGPEISGVWNVWGLGCRWCVWDVWGVYGVCWMPGCSVYEECPDFLSRNNIPDTPQTPFIHRTPRHVCGV